MITTSIYNEYYGNNITYTLIGCYDHHYFADSLLSHNMIDSLELNPNKFTIWNTPSNLNEAVKHRDLISFRMYYIKELIKHTSYMIHYSEEELGIRKVIYCVVAEHNTHWKLNKDSEYYERGGRCRKCPLGAPLKQYEKFFAKYGNHFQPTDFLDYNESLLWLNSEERFRYSNTNQQ